MSTSDIGHKQDAVVIGIDLGDVKNGLALGHIQLKTAVGLKTVSGESLRIELERLIKENIVEALVVGVPYNMAGQETKRTAETFEMVKKLHEWFDIKIELIDERWTTKQAKSMARNGDDDQGAAILITQTYLDGLL